RRFEKDGQLFEVSDLVRNLYPGNLAQKIARRIRCHVLGMKNGVDGVASTELQAIIALEELALYPLPVDKRSLIAAFVIDIELAVFRNNERIVALVPMVGNGQVFLHFSADGERAVIQIQRALFHSLDENQTGKDPGLDAGDRADDGLGRHRAKPRVQAIMP